MRKHPLALCETCPLQHEPCAPTHGPKDARIMVVSRSPGASEAMLGRPFSGPSGKLLDYLLEQHGAKRSQARVTNIVLCQTDKLSKKAIEACRPRLRAELQETNPEILIAASAESTKEFTGLSISAAKGQVHSPLSHWGLNGTKVIAANNPAAALRDSSVFPDLLKQFKLALQPRPNEPLPEVRWTEDADEASSYIRALRDYRVLGVDIESTGLEYKARITCIGVGFEKDGTYRAIVFGRNLIQNSEWYEAYLKPLLEQDGVRFTYHFGKYDSKVLRYAGTNAQVVEDTYALSYCLDERPDMGIHKLEYLLADRFGWPDYEPQIVKEGKKNGQDFQPVVDKYQTTVAKRMELVRKSVDLLERAKTEEVREKRAVTLEKRILAVENIKKPSIVQLMEAKGTNTWEEAYFPELYHYCGIDVAGTRKLLDTFVPEAKQDNVYGVYERLLIPATNALANVERTGIPFNVDKAINLRDTRMLPALARLQDEARAATGRLDMQELNLSSPKQVGEYLYSIQGYPDLASNHKVERSVDEVSRNALLALPNIGEEDRLFLEKLGEYISLRKAISTYVDGMIEKVIDGRIHTTFKFGTVTGRLSSAEPNVQNIPRANDKDVADGLYPANLKSLFVASSPDHCIVQADYSQAELRTVAYMAQDENMIQAYMDGKDLHAMLAENLYGQSYTKNDRYKAKTTNFSVLYGIDPFKLSLDLNIPYNEAQALINTFWRMYPKVKQWVGRTQGQIKSTGEVVSPWGRKRRFALITNENVKDVLKAGVNFPIQSTASDFTLYCVIVLDKLLDPHKAQLIITVHDSIALNCLRAYKEEAMTTLRYVMETAPKEALGWDMPFKVDLGYGDDYGHIEEIELGAAA